MHSVSHIGVEKNFEWNFCL